MDLAYQVLNPWPAADFQLAYPGKKCAPLAATPGIRSRGHAMLACWLMWPDSTAAC
jgi:hypothetical protein